LKANKDNFLISFQYDIYNWIEACIEKVATIPTIREGLVHYRNLIRKLTNQMGDEMDKDIIKIIETPEDIKAMHIIYSEYANILAKKESDFWFEVYDRLEDKIKDFKILYLTDSDIVKERIKYKDIVKERKNKNSYLGLSFTKKIKEYKIRCELYLISSDSNLTIDFQIKKENEEVELSSKIIKILKDIGFDKQYNGLPYFYLREEIKFYGSEKATFELFDDKKFKKLVKSTSDEVAETLKNILGKEDILLQDI